MTEKLREEIAELISRHGDGRIKMVEGFKVKDYTMPIEVTDQILALIKEAGYVKLAEDQSLPEKEFISSNENYRYAEAQKDMLKAGWRKVGETP